MTNRLEKFSLIMTILFAAFFIIASPEFGRWFYFVIMISFGFMFVLWRDE